VAPSSTRFSGAGTTGLVALRNGRSYVGIELNPATVARWPEIPELGMVTFVDAGKVRRKRDPGRCFPRSRARR
jgi:hypothetical protein